MVVVFIKKLVRTVIFPYICTNNYVANINSSVATDELQIVVNKNDRHKKDTVKVLYDQSFEGQNVVIHPLRNTASISIKFDDLKRFTEHFGHKWTTGDVYKEE